MSQEELVSPFLHRADSRPIPEEEIRSQAEQAVSTAQRLTEVDEQQPREEQENSLSNGGGGGESSDANGRGAVHPTSTYDQLKNGPSSVLHTPLKNLSMRGLASSYQNSPKAPDESPSTSIDALRKAPAGGWRRQMHRELLPVLCYLPSLLKPIARRFALADLQTLLYIRLCRTRHRDSSVTVLLSSERRSQIPLFRIPIPLRLSNPPSLLGSERLFRSRFHLLEQWSGIERRIGRRDLVPWRDLEIDAGHLPADPSGFTKLP